MQLVCVVELRRRRFSFECVLEPVQQRIDAGDVLEVARWLRAESNAIPEVAVPVAPDIELQLTPPAEMVSRPLARRVRAEDPAADGPPLPVRRA